MAVKVALTQLSDAKYAKTCKERVARALGAYANISVARAHFANAPTDYKLREELNDLAVEAHQLALDCAAPGYAPRARKR